MAEIANLVALRKHAEAWQQLAGNLQEAALTFRQSVSWKDFAATQDA